MKKLLLSLALFSSIALPLFATIPTHAVDVLNPVCVDENGAPLPESRRPAICNENKALDPDGNNPLFGPDGILTTVANILSLVVGIAAVLSIMISAVRLIMSGGEPNAISGARRGILFAVIGLVIAATAQLLVRFVLSKL